MNVLRVIFFHFVIFHALISVYGIRIHMFMLWFFNFRHSLVFPLKLTLDSYLDAHVYGLLLMLPYHQTTIILTVPASVKNSIANHYQLLFIFDSVPNDHLFHPLLSLKLVSLKYIWPLCLFIERSLFGRKEANFPPKDWFCGYLRLILLQPRIKSE